MRDPRETERKKNTFRFATYIYNPSKTDEQTTLYSIPHIGTHVRQADGITTLPFFLQFESTQDKLRFISPLIFESK